MRYTVNNNVPHRGDTTASPFQRLAIECPSHHQHVLGLIERQTKENSISSQHNITRRDGEYAGRIINLLYRYQWSNNSHQPTITTTTTTTTSPPPPTDVTLCWCLSRHNRE